MTSGTEAAIWYLPGFLKHKGYFRSLSLSASHAADTATLSSPHTHTPLPSQRKDRYIQGTKESNNNEDLDVLEKPCTCWSK